MSPGAVGPDGVRKVRGVILQDGGYIEADHVVLAVGHSARDTFQMLFDRGVHIELSRVVARFNKFLK